MEKRVINPWTWQDSQGFVQANEVSGAQRTLYCAGQTSVDDNGAPMHPGDMAAQLGRALDNLETVLTQAGMRLSDVVRLNIFTTDVDLFFQHYESVARRMGEAGCRQASTLLGVSRLAFPELLVESKPPSPPEVARASGPTAQITARSGR